MYSISRDSPHVQAENQFCDIFDRLIELPVFRHFNPFYRKHKEIFLYLFFGGLSFFVSVGTFALFNAAFGLSEHIANVISWIVTVTFVYFTNKLWVFRVKLRTRLEAIAQILSFFAARLGTLFVEEAILFVFITRLDFNSVAVKIAAQVVVIVLNYVVSKVFVFRRKENA